MKNYAKIVDVKVNQTQPYPEDGFIEVPLNAVRGWIKDGETFSAPIIVPTQEEIKDKQIEVNKRYLKDTDFKMTIDYYDTMTTEKQLALVSLRAEARAFIKANEA